jgi:hypothetical protein
MFGTRSYSGAFEQLCHRSALAVSRKPQLAQLGGSFYGRDPNDHDPNDHGRDRGTPRGLRSSIFVGSSPRHKPVYTLLGHRLGWRPATHRQPSQRTRPALEDCAFEPQLVNGMMPAVLCAPGRRHTVQSSGRKPGMLQCIKTRQTIGWFPSLYLASR